MAICALCKREKTLQQSHIIPKLVYRRIRSVKNSRFRSLDNINLALQDGEKRAMLCHDCEELFSSFERIFSSKFLDIFLKNHKVPRFIKGDINNYILTVAWRILYDDLYRLNSHSDHFTRAIFDDFCDELGKYLLSLTHGSNIKMPHTFKNKIYKIESVTKNKKIIELSKGSLFGYSVWFSETNSFSVIVYYAGLVFVTDYIPQDNCIMIGFANPIIKALRKKKVLREEIELQFREMAIQYDNGMTQQLKDKIKRYYSKD